MNKKQFISLLIIVFVLGLCPSISSADTDTTAPVFSRVVHEPASPIAGQAVYIDAIATDDYLMASIKLYVDDVNIKTCDFNGSGFVLAQCNFSKTTFGAGDHTYYAIATDNAGNTTRGPLDGTESFTVTSASVSSDTTAPTFSRIVHSPDSPIAGQAVYVDTIATDNYLVANIKLYVDDINVKTCDFNGLILAQCNFSKTTFSVGDHTYYAVAVDGAGNTTRGPLEGTKSFTITGAPNTSAGNCSSFTYSDWSSCQSNGTETRTITSSSPSGCSGGDPMMLTMSCTYVQTDIPCVSYTYSNWDTCQPNNTQYRRLVSTHPTICVVGNPIFTQSCTYNTPTCASWTYSAWGSCADSQQNRTITSSQPASCVGGNPVLNQSCNSIPSCAESNWTSTLTPTSCPSNGQQVKKWTKIGQCQNGVFHSSEESISCKYVLVEVPNKVSVVETKNNPPVSTNNEQIVNQEKTVTNSQVAEQRKSDVASAVQKIIQITEKDGGVGEQVKVIAETQAQSQEKLETSLQKVQSRSGFTKFFVGPNYSEINNAKKLLEQNREQIKQLDEIQNQITNKSDKQKLTEQVQLLEQTNQEIEDSLNTSQKGFSLFGWLVRLFVK